MFTRHDIRSRNPEVAKEIAMYQPHTSYLALLASKDRNWVECQLEPNPKGPTIPDDYPPPKQYLFQDQKRYWLIVCLDGAPDRVWAFHDEHRIRYAEQYFREAIIQPEARHIATWSCVAEMLGEFRDGRVYSCEDSGTAKMLANHIAITCDHINKDTQPSWEWEYHMRAGIARSVSGAFDALLHAKRDQCCFLQDDQKFAVGTLVCP